jgi:hypothetical protein
MAQEGAHIREEKFSRNDLTLIVLVDEKWRSSQRYRVQGCGDGAQNSPNRPAGALDRSKHGRQAFKQVGGRAVNGASDREMADRKFSCASISSLQARHASTSRCESMAMHWRAFISPSIRALIRSLTSSQVMRRLFNA